MPTTLLNDKFRETISVTPDTPFTPYDWALPGFEEYQLIKPVSPVDPQNHQRTLDLARLLLAKESDVKNFPAGIPTKSIVARSR